MLLTTLTRAPALLNNLCRIRIRTIWRYKMIYTANKRIRVYGSDHSVIKWVVAFMVFVAILTFTVWEV